MSFFWMTIEYNKVPKDTFPNKALSLPCGHAKEDMRMTGPDGKTLPPGSCSNSSYDNKTTCEDRGYTWTEYDDENLSREKQILIAKYKLCGHTFFGDASLMAFWPKEWTGDGDKQMKKGLMWSIFSWLSAVFALGYAWLAAAGNISKSGCRMVHVSISILTVWIFALVMWAVGHGAGYFFEQRDCWMAIGFFIAYVIAAIVFYVKPPTSAFADSARQEGPEVVIVRQVEHVHHYPPNVHTLSDYNQQPVQYAAEPTLSAAPYVPHRNNQLTVGVEA